MVTWGMILLSTAQLASVPKRIISLVPSQTELLSHLGLEEETIAITKFCIHPADWFRNKIRVGGTKDIDIQSIISLNPDLVIANKEENVQGQVEELADHCNVWVTDVNNLDKALKMIGDIGLITNKIEESADLISQIKNRFNRLKASGIIPAAYLIWKKPYMTVGGDTFINDMLQKAGFENVFSGRRRYPEISVEEIKVSGARILFLSSEPFPFQQKHIDELQAQLPGVKIRLVDGEMFSWYGSRLLQAPGYFEWLKNDCI